MDLKLLGILAALLSAASWAAGTVLYKRLGEQSSALELNFAKSVLSLALLLLAVAAEYADPVTWRAFFLLGLSGVMGITLGDTFFFAALKHLGASKLIMLSLLGQVLTVLLAMLLLDERPSLLIYAGILLVMAGVTLVLLASRPRVRSRVGHEGLFFGLLSVLSMAVAVIITKSAMSDVTPVQATFIRMLWGTAGLLVYGMLVGRLGPWLAHMADFHRMQQIAGVVMVSTFGGFYLSHVALKHIDVSIANTLNSTEPLFVLPMAAIFLKEHVTRSGLIGAVVATLGIACIING